MLCRGCLGVLGRRLMPTLKYARPVTVTCATTGTHRVLKRFPSSMRVRLDKGVVGGIGNIAIPGSKKVGKVRITTILNVMKKGTSGTLRILDRIAYRSVTGAGRLVDRGVYSYSLIRKISGLCVATGMEGKRRFTSMAVRRRRAGVAEVRGSNRILLSGPCGSRIGAAMSGSGLAIGSVLSFTSRIHVRSIRPVVSQRVGLGSTVTRRKLSGGCKTRVNGALVRM